MNPEPKKEKQPKINHAEWQERLTLQAAALVTKEREYKARILELERELNDTKAALRKAAFPTATINKILDTILKDESGDISFIQWKVREILKEHQAAGDAADNG